MGKYIYTNRSTPDEIQRYLDDVADVGALVYAQAGYEVGLVSGRPVVYGKKNGATNKKGMTTAFDVVKEKVGDVGFYCLNARDYYKDEDWADQLPDAVPSYTGLFEIDDISEWVGDGEET